MVALGTDMGMGMGTRVRAKGTRGTGGEVEGMMGRSSSWGRITEASELGGPQSSLPTWALLTFGAA